MQSKSTRGVQLDEVWAAADALVADGQRPTIERVRLKIGRGSPNTVSPMLEGWFATLGTRLHGGALPGGAPELPAAVSRAVADLWKVAQATAHHEAVERLAEERKTLDLERIGLLAGQADLAQQQKALQLHEAALQEMLSLAKAQLAQLAAQVKQLQGALESRDNALAESQLAIEQLTTDREADRKEHVRQANSQAEALRRAEERSAANERRLLAEVDRSRQELKNAQAAHADSERRIESLRNDTDAKTQALNLRVHDGELERASIREKLSASEALAMEFQRLLQEQTLTTNAVIAQAGRAAAKSAPRKSTAPTKRRNAVPRTQAPSTAGLKRGPPER